jgi:hypothetical protein
VLEFIGIAVRDVVLVIVLAWITQKLSISPFVRLVICCAGPLLISPVLAFLSGYGGEGRVIMELLIAAAVVGVFLVRTYKQSQTKGP